jgi:zinc and cadmium transporter
VNHTAWLGALISVGIVSAIPLAIAILLPREETTLTRLVRRLVAFAIGALLGAAFLHLIPDAFSGPSRDRAGALLLIGFFAFFAIERFIWRHIHEPQHRQAFLPPLAAINLIGDALHNVLDGMAIGAAFLAGPSLGIATATAVVLHEVPQEVGDFGVLLHAGLTRQRALLWNVISALAAFAGVLLVLLVGGRVAGFAAALIPVAAGGFIYIAASDLVPELKADTRNERTGALLLSIIAGLVLVSLPLALEAR